MENNKKKENVIGCEYFINILDRWNKNAGIITKKDLYGIIDSLDIEFGYQYKKKASHRLSCVKKLEEMLTSRWFEKIESGKIGRRGKDYIYSLKLEKGREKESLEEIKNLFRKYLSEHIRGKHTVRDIKKPEPEIKVKETKKVVSQESKLKPRLGTLENLWKVLTWMNKNKTNEIKRTELGELLGFQNFSESNLKGWENSLKNAGILLDAVYTSPGKGGCSIKIRNVYGTMAAIREVAKRLYNVELEIGTGRVKGFLKGRKFVKPVVQLVDTSGYKDKLIYAIGGIVMKNNQKAIDINTLCSILNKDFGIVETKNEILEAIKEVEELESIQYGQRIGLKEGKFSWDDIKEKYGPQKRKKTVIARLTLPFEEIEKHFEDTKLLSKISENDAIYSITYEDSVHSIKTWAAMFRKFRGTDIVFDEVLTGKVEEEIERLDRIAYKGNLEYEIEEDIF